MKKWQKWAIALCIVVVVFSRYGYIFFGSFGIDTDGYVADQNGKSVAYKLHGAYNQAEIDQCFRDININPTPKELAKLEGMIRSGAMTASPELKRCIEKRVDGYASPKKDLKNAAHAVKNFFADDPEPQLFKTIVYNPRQYGPRGMTINIPSNTLYECSGSYRQKWFNGHYEYIGCNGMRNRNMPDRSVKLMPIEDARQYGKVLVNAKSGKTLININIPQIPSSYEDITGSLTFKFYR